MNDECIRYRWRKALKILNRWINSDHANWLHPLFISCDPSVIISLQQSWSAHLLTSVRQASARPPTTPLMLSYRTKATTMCLTISRRASQGRRVAAESGRARAAWRRQTPLVDRSYQETRREVPSVALSLKEGPMRTTGPLRGARGGGRRKNGGSCWVQPHWSAENNWDAQKDPKTKRGTS